MLTANDVSVTIVNDDDVALLGWFSLDLCSIFNKLNLWTNAANLEL
jgi:hypothetical protein